MVKNCDPYTMLDLVVNDALEGVDVIHRYRRFYAMMLANADLHEAFIVALEMAERLEEDKRDR